LAASTVISLVLNETGRILLSKLFTLEVFGYYTLASSISGALAVLGYPMSNAIYPRLSERVASENFEGVSNTYLTGSQWLGVLIVPPALIIAIFAHMTVFVWTNSPALANNVAPILRFLVIGSLFNALMNPPHVLQLASGWPELSFKVNTVAAIIVVPLLIFVVPRFGAVGAAFIWMAMNFLYLVADVYLMHRRILRGLMWTWYRNSVAVPIVVSLLLCGILSLVMPSVVDRREAASILILGWVTVASAVALVQPMTRAYIFDFKCSQKIRSTYVFWWELLKRALARNVS
jgi:O-antigen/teichoic acid export membrane protein